VEEGGAAFEESTARPAGGWVRRSGRAPRRRPGGARTGNCPGQRGLGQGCSPATDARPPVRPGSATALLLVTRGCAPQAQTPQVAACPGQAVCRLSGPPSRVPPGPDRVAEHRVPSTEHRVES